MEKEKHPLHVLKYNKPNQDTWFYYYSRPVTTYMGVKIWKSKHKKTGLLTFYSLVTGVHARTLESQKEAIRKWTTQQQRRDNRKVKLFGREKREKR